MSMAGAGQGGDRYVQIVHSFVPDDWAWEGIRIVVRLVCKKNMGSSKSVPEAWISSMTAVPSFTTDRVPSFHFCQRSTTEARSFLSNVVNLQWKWEDKPVEIREISRNLEKWETRCSSCCLRCLGHPATQCEQQLHCFGRRRTLWRT